MVTVSEVFGSNRRVALESAVYLVCVTLIWAAVQTSDRSWADPPVSLRGGLLGGLAFAAFMRACDLFRLVGRRKEARRAIGPRFDTDRPALAAALRTGELPADPTLDGPLLAALRIRRQLADDADDRDLPRWVSWPFVAVGLTGLVWFLGWPWTLVILVPAAIGWWRRWSRPAVDLDALRSAVERRLRVPTGDGGLA
jgi:hypothetical protein